MKNARGNGDRLTLVASATRTSGVPCVESGFAGFPVTSVSSGQPFVLDVALTKKSIPFIAGSTVGNIVHINDTTGALTKTAYGTAGGSGTRPFARVVAIPTAHTATSIPHYDVAPKTGFMHVVQLPQTLASVA
jgi:hypothetical protein